MIRSRKFKWMPTAWLLAASVNAWALTVEVQRFSNDGAIPVGYQNVADGIDAAESVKLSQAPFVDYLVPNNSGSAGITAQKEGGEFIVGSTADEFTGGANSGANPDRYHVVFEWDDGTPLPFGLEYYGVSWTGWTASEVATLTTRIDLVTTEPVTVFHWFNDGWNYNADGSGHDILNSHVLVVTHYTASGTEVDSYTEALPSGGADLIFGDHRQFYSAIITATRTAPGDYLIIQNNGGNVGYKGTGVALLGGGTSGLTVGEENATEIGPVYGLTPEWGDSSVMGLVYMPSLPWIYQVQLGWTYLGTSISAGTGETGYWIHHPNLGWLYTQANYGGTFWNAEKEQFEQLLP